MPVPTRKENERSCICVLGVFILFFLRIFYWFFRNHTLHLNLYSDLHFLKNRFILSFRKFMEDLNILLKSILSSAFIKRKIAFAIRFWFKVDYCFRNCLHLASTCIHPVFDGFLLLIFLVFCAMFLVGSLLLIFLVFCAMFLVGSLLLIFLVFCVMFFFVLFFSVLCLVYQMLLVSLNCHVLIFPLVFSNVYLRWLCVLSNRINLHISGVAAVAWLNTIYICHCIFRSKSSWPSSD